MDYLARLIVIACITLVSIEAFAFGEVPTEIQQRWACESPASGNQSFGSTAAAACSARAVVDAYSTSDDTYHRSVSYSSSGACVSTYGGSGAACPFTRKDVVTCVTSCAFPGTTNSASTFTATKLAQVVNCPSGSNSIAGSPQRCECAINLKPNSNKSACVPYSCGAPGSYSAVTQPDMVVQNGGSFCKEGCTVTPASTKVAVDGSLYSTWPFVASGQACGGKAVAVDNPVKSGDDASPAPQQCPANQCPGTINGASVCVACKATTTPGPSSSASAPDASASGGAVGTTTTSSTSCNGTSCTTTTVTKDLQGNIVGSKSEEKTQPTFCKENPESPMCKKSSFGGSCGAYNCDGDAVQCAIAARIHKTACDWEEHDPAMKAIGDAALRGVSRPEGHPANEPETKSLQFSSVIDQSDPIGGGCPVDQSISVGSVSVVIPWSKACNSLQMLGNIVVAFSILAAAFIVFRN